MAAARSSGSSAIKARALHSARKLPGRGLAVALRLAFREPAVIGPDRRRRGGPRSRIGAGRITSWSQFASDDIGNEFSLTARWAIPRSWCFQGLASYARPGEALRSTGADKDWTTLQASLYQTF